MEVLIEKSTKIIDPLSARVDVDYGVLTLNFEEGHGFVLSKILVIARKEAIIWGRDLSDEEKKSFQIRENFDTLIYDSRSRLDYNYTVAVEMVFENGQKAIAFIVDRRRAKGSGIRKNGSFDRRKTVCDPIIKKNVMRLDGETFDELAVMLFNAGSNGELLLRTAVPEQMSDSILRGNTKQISFSGGTIRLELEIPVLEEEVTNVLFCCVKDDIRYNMKYDINKQQSQWIINASIDLNQVELSRPFWVVFAETKLKGYNVLVPFSISPKLYRKLRLFAPHGMLKNGNIFCTKPTKKKTLQFLVRERIKYDSYVTKVKEAIAIAMYLFTRKKNRKNQTWLIFEKFCSMAQDNGFAFFRYCMDNLLPSEKKHIYYIIDKDSSAYGKVKKYGRNAVRFMSIRHMYLCLCAKMYVASESSRHLYLWRGKPSIIENKIKDKPVFFLQHGVTAFKRVDKIFGKSGTDPMTYFVATSKQEQDIVVNNFGYKRENVPILGFTRWDLLEDKSEYEDNTILVMPTWRNWLQDMDTEEFRESDYFRHYSSLLENSRLDEVMGDHNTKMVFYIHPKFQEYAQDFAADNDRVSVILFGQQPLNELMMKCKLLITDYSSVAWDFYYMGKPVVFYQFDYDKYIMNHSSYIDMTKQLFGDRVTDHDGIVDCICSYIGSDFREKPKFGDMRPEMFQYMDRNNCKRTYDYIKNLNNKKNKSHNINSYMDHYCNDPIDEDLILLESQNGKKIDGSIYYLLQELLADKRYDNFKLYLSAEGEAVREQTISKMGQNEKVHVVLTESSEYYRVLATAKYLINDATFRNTFIKRDGQKYLNLWHGTPLKNMGRKAESDPDESGNVTKNFICADYLLYPNEYTRQHMVEDYMIENLSNAMILYCGYPRNVAFFNDEAAREIRANEELTDKKVYVYMPTWRKNAGDAFQDLLTEIDQKLSEQEVIYAKMHPLADSAVNYATLKHIRRFPDRYETYEFLNAADCLITDYSSVMFDFAVTGRRTVLFTFDEEEYCKERGMYLSLDELPFEQADNADDLLALLRSDYSGDTLTRFKEQYCAYDSGDAAKKLLERFLFDNTQGIKEDQLRSNGKKNVFVFAGDVSDPTIEANVMPFLASIDQTENNIFLTYKRKDVIRKASVLHRLPEGVSHFGMPGAMDLTQQQRTAKKKYEKGELSFERFWQISRDAYEEERKRNYGTARIDEIVIFDNLDEKILLEYSLIDCKRSLMISKEKYQLYKTFDPALKEYIQSRFDLRSISINRDK
ncbi:MAG: hypothetical protein E7221_00595 [Clostridiales bacterium]|nr:hypothetical protein [Clostridiales bacterium]